MFRRKADDNIESRYTICLAARNLLLRGNAQTQSFEAYHEVMLQESIKYDHLMRHVTSGQVYDAQYEYETWCHWNSKVTGRNNPRGPPPPTDEQWVQLVLSNTKTWLSSQKPHAPGVWPTWRQYHAEEIAAFSESGSPPNKNDAVEVYYCGSSEDVANSIDSGALLVIDQQQPFAWNGPPLNDCFQRLSDPECLRRLQVRHLTRNGRVGPRSFNETMTDEHLVIIPTRPRDTINAKGQVTRQCPFFRKTLQQIQKKLIMGTPKNDDKWNVLTMVQSSHCSSTRRTYQLDRDVRGHEHKVVC
ncbi:hypothetical protein IL306_009875 [Fusarium sp. DS 682]|nr:hypothetical protein IL306_009875 [Fusarium sp. DS 682]